MKKALALILTFALTLTLMVFLSACGKNSKDGKDSAIIGTWTADFPVGKAINNSLSGEAIGDSEEAQMISEAMKGIDFDAYNATTTLIFKKDGSYSMEVSKDEMTDAVKSFMTKFGNNFADALEKSLEGTGLTLESAMNMTKDELVDALVEQFDTEEIEKELDELSETGKYALKENTLSLANKDNEKVEFEIELSDGKLVLVKSNDTENSEESEILLPWTFTKAK